MSEQTEIQLVDNPDLDLISSLIADLRQMRHVLRHGVEPGDLIDPHARTLFEAMLDAHRSGRTRFEPEDLQRAFKAKGTTGWQPFVAACLRRGAAIIAESYAIEIRQRKLRQRATEVLDQARHQLETIGTAEQAIGNASAELAKLYAEAKPPKVDTVADAAVRTLEQIKLARQRQESIGVPTGLMDLDETIGGMFPGELVVLAARPSVGKTSLAVHVALNIAKRGKPVALFSFEMRNEELAMRTLSAAANIPLQHLRCHDVSDGDIRTLEAKTTESVGWPLYLFDDSRMNVDQISSFARMLHDDKPLSAVVIDYLTIMPGTQGGRDQSTTDAIGRVTSNLKQLAKILDCPVLILSQLSRDAAREGKPKLHHLRSSGSIEQDADMVWLIDRNDDDKSLVDLEVAKNRNGERGVVHLKWEPEYTRFGDRDVTSYANYEREFDDFNTGASL